MAAEETSETESGQQRTPLTMIIPSAVLVAVAAAIALIPQLGSVIQAAATRFEDQAGYNATVLAGAHIAHPAAIAATESTAITVTDVLTGAGSALGSLALAFVALYWRRLPLLRRGYEPGTGLTAPIQRFQSGVLNDYVTWIVLGLAAMAARSPWSSANPGPARPRRPHAHLSAMTLLTSSSPLYSPSGMSRSELSAFSSAWLLLAWSTSCCLEAG